MTPQELFDNLLRTQKSNPQEAAQYALELIRWRSKSDQGCVSLPGSAYTSHKCGKFFWTQIIQSLEGMMDSHVPH